jgi:hypothetical protein
MRGDSVHGLKIALHVELPQDLSVARGKSSQHSVSAAGKDDSRNQRHCRIFPAASAFHYWKDGVPAPLAVAVRQRDYASTL